MQDAMSVFTPAFLIKHFAKETPLKTQKAIEHYIVKLGNPDAVKLFMLALVGHAYQINEQVPNAELLFY